MNELASTYLESTVAYGFATKGVGEAAPYSFYSAMHDDESGVIVNFKCMPTISDKLCNFDIVKPPQPPSESGEAASEIITPL